MRVLTFLHSFEPGGVERIALRLIRQWRRGGLDAPLFMGRTEGAMRDDVGKGLDWTGPRQPRFIGTARWETLWMILTLPRAIRRLHPDVLFCAGNSYAVVAVAMKLILGRHCPPILAKISNDLDRRDGMAWQRFLYRVWLRIQGRFFDQVIGMETPMTAEIAQYLHIPPRKITIIPDPALSDELIAQLRVPRAPWEPGSGRRFVAMGRLCPQKNFALLLRAFASGRNGHDRLTIIGDGPDRDKLETLARSLRLSDQVDFLGYVANPAEILPRFDVLLLSSDYEGVPAVILEALAAGLWIVATECSRSMPTLLRDGQLGELVPVRNEELLAGAIARCDPSRQDQALGLSQARRFSIENSAELYVQELARLRNAHAREAQTRS